MNILSAVSSTETGEAAFAIISIGQEAAKNFLDLRKKCAKALEIPGCYGVIFNDSTPTVHYDDDDLLDLFNKEVDEGNKAIDIEDVLDGGWEEMPKGYEPSGEELTVDLGIMTVKKDGIIWRLYLKHSTESVETCTINWETIESIATDKVPTIKAT